VTAAQLPLTEAAPAQRDGGSYLKVLPALLIISAFGGAAAGYCALRLAGPFALGPLEPVVVWGASLLFAALLATCFLVIPIAGRPSVDAVSVFGFSSFGFLSVLLVAVLAWDIVRLALAGLSHLGVGLPGVLVGSAPQRWIAMALLGGALCVTVAALLNARRPAAVRVLQVRCGGLPPELAGLKILQLSDIHIGPGIGLRRIEQIVAQSEGLGADLIAVTGDIADGSASRLRQASAPLGRLTAPLGVWFVTGNHDYYSGVDPWCARMAELGMEVLINESRVLDHKGARLQVAGVTDPSGALLKAGHRPQLEAARGEAPADFRLLLAHQPNCAPAAAKLGFDLQLSGHTHGGQYFPFNFLIRLGQRYVAGLYRIGAMQLFVHRGTTWWGPPMRLGSRHEIVLLELESGAD
jgi:predicted MPP superfamily phosphohydrolase